MSKQAADQESAETRGPKVALVTGGATGIGLGVARALIANSFTVVITDVDERRGQSAAAEICAHYRSGTEPWRATRTCRYGGVVVP